MDCFLETLFFKIVDDLFFFHCVRWFEKRSSWFWPSVVTNVCFDGLSLPFVQASGFPGTLRSVHRRQQFPYCLPTPRRKGLAAFTLLQRASKLIESLLIVPSNKIRLNLLHTIAGLHHSTKLLLTLYSAWILFFFFSFSRHSLR